MRDNLDLEALTQEVEAYQRTLRRQRRTNVVAVVLLLVLWAAIHNTLMSAGTVYSVSGDNRWQTVSQAFGGPRKMQAAADGSIWVLATLYGEGLYRFDSGETQYLGAEDIDQSSRAIDAFTFTDGEMWVVARPNVLYVDERAWHVFPDVTQSNDFMEIAADGNRAVIVDYAGSLSYYDGNRWMQTSLQDALPDLRPERGTHYPSLLWDDEGTLWLSFWGIWRFDGKQWQRAARAEPTSRTDYRLLAVYDDTLWMSRPSGISGLYLDTGARRDYSNTEMKFPVSARPGAATVIEDALWVASTAGIATFDGRTWQTYANASSHSLPDYEISGLVIDREGFPWVAAHSPRINDRFYALGTALSWFATYQIPLVIGIVLFIVWVVPSLRTRARRTQAKRNIVFEAVPDLPRYPVTMGDTGKRSVARQIMWVILFLAVPVLAFPVARASLWQYLLFVFIGWGILFFGPALLRLARRSDDTVGRRYLLRNIAMAFQLLLAMAIALAPYIVVVSFLVSQWDASPRTMSLVVGILALLSLLSVFYGILQLPTWIVLVGPYAAGQYDKALRLISSLRPLFVGFVSITSLRTVMLYQAGRFEEAGAVTHATLAETQNIPGLAQAICLYNYGITCSALGRDEQALAALEASIRLAPERDFGYRGLIDHYLERSQYQERALELSSHMMRAAPRPFLPFPWLKSGWGATPARRALALAHNGQMVEANDTMARAFAEGGNAVKPAVATFHYYAAEIRALQGFHEQAREHLRQASSLDPAGYIGARARDRLAATAELDAV